MRRFFALLALSASLAACHLALGLEKAETLEGEGGRPGSSTDATCEDANPCTADRCDDGSCVNEPLDGPAPESEQTAGDCNLAVCTAGLLGSSPDDADLPVDGTLCTEDVCVDGMPDNPPLAGGTDCSAEGGVVCNGEGACVECHSNDQCVDPEECGEGGTPWVCGCTAATTCMDLGLTCGGGGFDECDQALACSNGAMDGTETDVDCGGPQPTQGGSCAILCESGRMCNAPTDCVSGVCTNNVCE